MLLHRRRPGKQLCPLRLIDLLVRPNYVMADDPAVAEGALAVAHDHQSDGAATALLCRLGEAARGNGIQTFTVDVLAGNYDVLKGLHDAGWLDTTPSHGSVLRIGVDLANVTSRRAHRLQLPSRRYRVEVTLPADDSRVVSVLPDCVAEVSL
jgi:hypothetical protein